jgi:WG containing repeat
MENLFFLFFLSKKKQDWGCRYCMSSFLKVIDKRMKKLTLLILFIYSIGNLNAQMVEYLLIPFEHEGRWGYVDKNDSIIVQPVFEEAYPTFYFRGRIKIKGKYGFINEKGEILIKPKYDTAEDFKFGIAKVSRKGKSMYIKPDGKENKQSIALCGGVYRECLHKINFVGIDTFKVDDKYGITISAGRRENGKLVYSPDTLLTRFENVMTLGRQYVILESEGKKALFFDQTFYPDAEYVDSTLNFKYDDFIFFSCQDKETETHEIFGFKEDNKWGYIKLFYTPKEIIKAKYLSINSMERGLALVEFEKGKFGYVDQSGKEYFKRN